MAAPLILAAYCTPSVAPSGATSVPTSVMTYTWPKQNIAGTVNTFMPAGGMACAGCGSCDADRSAQDDGTVCTDAPGMGSGLTYDRCTGKLYAVTDRGPNQDCEDLAAIRGTSGPGHVDSGKGLPSPAFAPSMAEFELGTAGSATDGIRNIRWTHLKQRSGSPVSGMSNKGSDDSMYNKDCETPEHTGSRNAPYGLDLEDIQIMPNGRFIGCDEYGPKVVIWNSDGTVEMTIIPEGLEGTYTEAATGSKVAAILPPVWAGRRKNRGCENLALKNHGGAVTAYVCMQSTMDGAAGTATYNKDLRDSRAIRCVTLDVRDPLAPELTSHKVFLASDAKTEYTEAKRGKASKQKDVKLSGAWWLRDERVALLERAKAGTADGEHHWAVTIFEVDFSSGTDLAAHPSYAKYSSAAAQTVPAAGSEGLLGLEYPTSQAAPADQLATLAALSPAVVPMRTAKLLDLDDLPSAQKEGMPSKLEGFFLRKGGSEIVFSDDNDFGLEKNGHARVFVLPIAPAIRVTEGECAGDGALISHGARFTRFEPSEFPTTPQKQESVVVSPRVTFSGITQQLQWNEIARSGDRIGSKVFGEVKDKNGAPIGDPATCCSSEGHGGATMVSDMQDFASLLRSRGSDPTRLWSVVHFEDMPAQLQAVEIKQQPDGRLTAVGLHDVDFSAHGGVAGTCAGSVSPWNTHLGGEEWGIPDAKAYDAWTTVEDVGRNLKTLRYHGLSASSSLAEIKAAYKPYSMGYVNEVSVDDSNGSPVITATKHYTMGRYAVELPYCLPTDPQVCYVMDDRTNGLPCMFKPTTKNDLSAGQLLCAKITMTSEPGEGAGEYDVSWIDLGTADSATIQAAIATTTFSSLFDTAAADDSATTKAYVCPAGFTPVNAGSGLECLKLIGDPILASRFETRRYAAMLGATTEWTKMEGMTFDPVRNELYMAMSQVYKSMEDEMHEGAPKSKYDVGGFNEIKAKFNKCGCVYRMSLNAANEATHISPLVCGNYQGHNSGSAGHPVASSKDKCSIYSIANPDNIAFMEGHDKLLIGEDTSYHLNNAVWAYDMHTHSLTRILTVPRGAETTGVYYHSDINGYAYIMNQVQHPDPTSTYGRAGTVGYVGPIVVASAPGTPTAVDDASGQNHVKVGVVVGIAVAVAAAGVILSGLLYVVGKKAGMAAVVNVEMGKVHVQSAEVAPGKQSAEQLRGGAGVDVP